MYRSRVLVPLNQSLLACQPRRNYLVPQRSWHPLAALDNTMRDMGQQFRQMEREMDSAFRNFGFDGPSALAALSAGLEPEIVKEGDSCKYRLNVFMGDGFSPENIKVSLKDRVLTVEAKKEQKSEDGNSRVYEEFSRLFTLPENVDLKEVKSVLTPEGILKIEAPLPQEALPEPPKPQAIPITME